ncbi:MULTISPECIES: alkene reductase [unclassified Pusillimonas]|uniref:alkene reductase n=1 Tax=unclassified Pusillimonas TaxID=2640016 RepID=UPI000B9CC02D|nr:MULTISPECIES: alkene reductase [unclassified Pusillimonas]OXR48398.1 alkene reductase [Pusillimonas sp. T2]ROT44436.1 alkene reductase [Pusillimonas sp. NJUB218]
MVNLFEPVQFGSLSLSNRIVMSPLTRTRAGEGRAPTDLVRLYYCQRADAGLIITEATSITAQGVGYPDTAGIWSKAQVDGWKRVTEAVHARGGKIVLQLWHVGRVSDPELLNGEIPVAPSAIACEGQVSILRPKRDYVVPRALQTNEIAGIVADFVQAARNAKDAGFDGVEVHGANGFLIDQFLHDGSNQRTDQYGGSVENRARFLLEIVDAVCSVWPSGRVGVHLSPRAGVHAMRDSDPASLFYYVAEQLGKRNLAFMFVREPQGPDSLAPQMKKLFGGPVIINGSYTLETAQKAIDNGDGDAVAFGRMFIANPDLVARLRDGHALNEPDPSTFYGQGAKGYTDYPALSPADCEASAEA